MTDPRPTVGSYSDPTKQPIEGDFQIEDKRKKVNSPAKVMSEGIQGDIRKSVDENEKPAEKAMDYEEMLSDNDITVAKARHIVDSILSQGYYQESYRITSKASVTLRTRQQNDYVRYLQALENRNPKFMDEQNDIMTRYFLAASLVAFKGEEFENIVPTATNKLEVDKAFFKRLEWVNNAPERLVVLLATKVNQFDRMIQLVMTEGVVENF